MKILLIGNYKPDHQQSMLRYLSLMDHELKKLGYDIEKIQPKPFFGKFTFGPNLLTKWLGYIDKFIIFPFVLLKIKKNYELIHILDHSNAMYSFWLKNKKCIVTFHDSIGIKSAKGDIKEFQSSLTGKILQKWILSGIKKATMIISDSKFSENDIKGLLLNKKNLNIIFKTVHLGLHFPFKKKKPDQKYDAQWNFFNKKYILHVGSNYIRKNRIGVLKVFGEINHTLNGYLVFVGPKLSPEQINIAKKLNIEKKIIVIANIDNTLLEALYNNAYALLLPSLYEGFGWPIIEAQACGCPVVCSNRGPFPEITKDSALMSDVNDIKDFAKNLLKLENTTFREEIIEKGLENSRRFSTQEMAQKYAEAYEEVLKN